MDLPASVTELVARVTGGSGDGWDMAEIHGGQSGSQVYRLSPPAGEPLILKVLDPNRVPAHLAEDYPGIGSSEFRFYRELMPRLGLPGPRILAAERLPGGGSCLLMQDLTVAHWIPSADHCWTDAELRSVLATYALLHGRSLRLFQREPPPAWLQADPRREYDPDLVLACLGRLTGNDLTCDRAEPLRTARGLAALVREVARALDHEPSVVLYNDFYPSNVALPRDGGPARLFDWQLVGRGPLHMDICNIGLTGRDAAFAGVDREGLLDYYLELLAQESRVLPDHAEFRERCRFADLLGWGVFMPRIVKAVERAGQQGGRFSPWMDHCLQECLRSWAEAL
ncbi:MAG TPA: aminoglycoside phosphotransferase family protein [Symbiobacteriaceae bacterium]|jgi:hypothetical protein